MKKSDNVFLTTIYPASEPFLDEFFNSLVEQSYKDFDVLVVNDGIENFDKYIETYSTLNIIEKRVNSSLSKNREIGIGLTLELEYKYIIFGDSDDYFSENRVSESIDALNECDIVFNDLALFSKYELQENFLSNHIIEINSIHSYFTISNVFGFSNMAIRKEIIPKNLQFNNELIAVDWFFVSVLLIQNTCRVKFLNSCQTFYRQYDQNTIGMTNTMSVERINYYLKVKKRHYKELLEYCRFHGQMEYYLIYMKRYKELKELEAKLKDQNFATDYVKVVNKNWASIFTGWWSEIINIDDYRKYEN